MSTNLFSATMPSLILPINAGSGDSNSIDLIATGFDAEALTIVAPAVVADGGTITLMGSVDKGVTYCTIQDTAGVNIICPGAGKLIVYNGVFTALTNIKLHASAAVATQLTYQVFKAWRG